jgi:uncharacterized protein YndB with AHSA1/START domain
MNRSVRDSRHRARRLAAALTALTLAATTASLAAPALTPEETATLANGEPAVEAHIDPAIDAARVRAAIDIPQPPARVWSVMTDCARMLRFVPGLESCRVIEADPRGRWDVRAHRLNWAWFLPNIRVVFRAEYERPQLIKFRRISGDLKRSEGEWHLVPRDGGRGTRLFYRAILAADVPAPSFIVVGAIRKDMATVLRQLREECDRAGPQ